MWITCLPPQNRRSGSVRTVRLGSVSGPSRVRLRSVSEHGSKLNHSYRKREHFFPVCTQHIAKVFENIYEENWSIINCASHRSVSGPFQVRPDHESTHIPYKKKLDNFCSTWTYHIRESLGEQLALLSLYQFHKTCLSFLVRLRSVSGPSGPWINPYSIPKETGEFLLYKYLSYQRESLRTIIVTFDPLLI